MKSLVKSFFKPEISYADFVISFFLAMTILGICESYLENKETLSEQVFQYETVTNNVSEVIEDSLDALILEAEEAEKEWKEISEMNFYDLCITIAEEDYNGDLLILAKQSCSIWNKIESKSKA